MRPSVTLVQLRHAIGLRPLEQHHRHHVLLQGTALESSQHLFLRMKHPRRCRHHMALFGHGRYLDHRTPQIALQQTHTARRTEWRAHGADHRLIARHRRGALRCIANAPGVDAEHIGMHESRVKQLAYDPLGAARRLKLVYIGCPVGVHPRNQGHHIGQRLEIGPIQGDTRRARDRNPVDQVVG
jgi:hypothetical protein